MICTNLIIYDSKIDKNIIIRFIPWFFKNKNTCNWSKVNKENTYFFFKATVPFLGSKEQFFLQASIITGKSWASFHQVFGALYWTLSKFLNRFLRD